MWKRFLLGGFLIVALTAATTATAALLEVQNVVDALHQSKPLKLGGVLAGVKEGAPQTIMVIGSDKRSVGARSGARDKPHSDTMLLVRLDPGSGAISLLSIPRDLKVTIPERRGPVVAKVNQAFADGGAKLAVKTVERLTGLAINHVVDMHFAGFKRAVDVLGCVYADVDRRYFNRNIGTPETNFADIDIQPGYQKLCGQDALDYVRFRHDDTDIVRQARQQDFLRQVKDQLGVQGLLDKRLALEHVFGADVSTDVHSSRQILQILKLLVDSFAGSVRQVRFEVSLGPSYVTATREQIRRGVREFLRSDARPPRATAAGPGRRKGAGGGSTAGVSLSPASSSELSAAATQRGRLGFGLYYPAGRVQSGGMPDALRIYGIRDRQGHRHTAYRVVVSKGLAGEYYGVEGMDWTNPPILKQPSELHNYGNRVLEYFYSGRHLRLIAWRSPHAVYWLSNTLTDSLSNREMIAIARAARPVR